MDKPQNTCAVCGEPVVTVQMLSLPAPTRICPLSRQACAGQPLSRAEVERLTASPILAELQAIRKANELMAQMFCAAFGGCGADTSTPVETIQGPIGVDELGCPIFSEAQVPAKGKSLCEPTLDADPQASSIPARF